MENASKALIMAGSVLIAILVISCVVLMFDQIKELSSQDEEQKKSEQVLAFNNEFESFNRKDLYGSDIISVLNKALDNNKKIDNLGEENGKIYISVEIKIPITDENNNTFFKGTYDSNVEAMKRLNEALEAAKKKQETAQKKYINEKNEYDKNPYKYWSTHNNKTPMPPNNPYTEFRRKLFKCTGIKTDEMTGKIREMNFVEIDITNR